MGKTNIDILLENELKRYNKIISYNNNLMNETTYRFYNEAEEDQPMEDPNAMGQDPNMGADPNASADPNAMAQEPGMNVDPNMGQAAPDPNAMAQPDPSIQAPAPEMPPAPDMGGEPGDTEVDVTELVNATQSIAHRIEKTTGSLQRIYDKINDLEGSLTKMDAVIAKMGELEKQVQLMRPPTEDERRKALADKSYPYNVTNQDYLAGSGYKNQTDMETKPDRMSMLNSLMANYDKNDIKKSFYPDDTDKREGNY